MERLVSTQVIFSCRVKGLTMGCSVEAVGRLTESPGAGQRVEMTAKELKILGECNANVISFH